MMSMMPSTCRTVSSPGTNCTTATPAAIIANAVLTQAKKVRSLARENR